MKKPSWPTRAHQAPAPTPAAEVGKTAFAMIYLVMVDGAPIFALQSEQGSQGTLELLLESMEFKGRTVGILSAADATEEQLRRLVLMIDLKAAIVNMQALALRSRAAKSNIVIPRGQA